MSDFPIGIYRSSTFGGTLSNFKGVSGCMSPGCGAVRLFNVFLKGTSSSASNLTFYNNVNNNGSASTANVYLIVSLNAASPTTIYFDSHAGVLFPNGCFITTSAAIDFGIVGFRTETI